MAASAVRLDRHVNSIDVGESLWILGPQHPALLRGVIGVENAEAHGVLSLWAPPSPCLEGVRILETGLLVEIVGIEDQRFALGIEDPAEGPLGLSTFRHVVNL